MYGMWKDGHECGRRLIDSKEEFFWVWKQEWGQSRVSASEGLVGGPAFCANSERGTEN